MTVEELKKVPFRMQAHLALTNEHSTTYVSEDGRIAYCDHVPKNVYGGFKKGYRHWMLDGKVYKTKEKFLEALKEFEL